MTLHTASEIVSLARKLETGSAEFYENAVTANKQGTDVFQGFSKDNQKNTKQIERAYYGAASDAMEGTFAFNIEENDYDLETVVSGNPGYAGMLDKAINIEKLIARFYGEAAGQSQSLVGDVPRIFRVMVRGREERIEKLEYLLKSAEGAR